MTDTKRWWESKGVWGGIVSVIAFAASLAGYTLSDIDQATLAMLLPGIASGVGGVLAIFGRIKAKSRIG